MRVPTYASHSITQVKLNRASDAGGRVAHQRVAKPAEQLPDAGDCPGGAGRHSAVCTHGGGSVGGARGWRLCPLPHLHHAVVHATQFPRHILQVPSLNILKTWTSIWLLQYWCLHSFLTFAYLSKVFKLSTLGVARLRFLTTYFRQHGVLYAWLERNVTKECHSKLSDLSDLLNLASLTY